MGEAHRTERTGWLRAAILGANDGTVSTASLMIGVAASDAARSAVLVAGLAGMVAGAMSMAAGEYVSVSSQRDTERSDIARERQELRLFPAREVEELTRIYEHRGLDRGLAEQVAQRLTEVDPLGSHLRDELGLEEQRMARPVQASVVSAVSFVAGSAGPVVAAALAPRSARIALIAVVALVLLAASGAAGGHAGGASWKRGAARVLVGGALAMVVTALIGSAVGAAVA
jgi:VIT1/CCC1 family predicted Fe2+/Mn2+ transporter